ncbi:MAG: RHS repeat-associated core domain-containing protein [Pirellulaceae bacterium]
MHEINANADVDNTYESATLTEYLVENRNPTGYQQVLVERVTDALTNTETKRVVYTFGHDIIAQTSYTPSGPVQGETLVLHYDGHGSTRILTNLLAAIATIGGQRQLFFYDAYGNALGFNAALAGTTHLYSGEQFDSRINQQYLRARWYDASTGRFGSLDPYRGTNEDPQSLHKYLYTHADPINGIDPTGHFMASVMVGFASALKQHLPTLIEGAVIAGTLLGIGGPGAYLRNHGLKLMSEGAYDLGFYYYEFGTRVLGLAFFAVEGFSTAIGMQLLATSAMQLGRLAASRLLNSPSRMSVAFAGQRPTMEWLPNAGGVVRSEKDLVRIARQNGLKVPNYVKFKVDHDLEFLPKDMMEKTAKGPNVDKPIGGRMPNVKWNDFFDKVSGKIVIRVHPDALKSDEAIVAILAHELHDCTLGDRIKQIVG